MRQCKKCRKEIKEGIEICPYCGFIDEIVNDDSHCLKSGTLLDGRYVIQSLKESNEDTIVYYAVDNKSNQKVIIKELFPTGLVEREQKSSLVILKDDSKTSVYEKRFNEFIDEATQISKSGNREKLINCIADNNTAYMIFEFNEQITGNSNSTRKKALLICLIAIYILFSYFILFRLFSGNVLHKSYSASSFTQVVERMGARSVRFSRVDEQDSKNDSEYYVLLDAHDDDEYTMIRYRAGVSSYAIDPENIEECIIYHSFETDDDESSTIAFISFDTYRDAQRYYMESLQRALISAAGYDVDDVPQLFRKNEDNVRLFSGYYTFNIDADDTRVVYGCYVQGRNVIYLVASGEKELNEIHEFCDYMRIPDPYDAPLLWGD